MTIARASEEKIDNDKEASACSTQRPTQLVETITSRCSRFIAQRRRHVDNRGMYTLSRADVTRADLRANGRL